MAANTDFTGNGKVFNAHGKALAITKLAKNNMTQGVGSTGITSTVVAYFQE